MSVLTQYVNTPKNGFAQLTAADTAVNNPVTSVQTVYTAGSNGARIDAIDIQATGTTIAGLVRFFLSVDAGTTKRMIGEVAVTANTASTTLPAFSSVLNSDTTGFLRKGLVLAPNAILYATSTVINSINVIPTVAGDF
jgi:hypothetical protein